ncbi:MAG TPA: AfsR/SARP family transcriptional regulator [Gaiellaceae bacterium]|nr:AfsR/SARP family transcriptional regulator [Gaiellaceae bacterium]
MEFRILGPLEVREDGHSLPIGSGKQRAVLALLLLNAGEVVPTDRLIDALWGESPPASASNSVHIYVSQLRKVLGESSLLTRGRGYVLALEPGQLDLERFERLLDEGRNLLAAGDAERAGETLRAALALWRGAPLADVANEPFAQREIARLEDVRLAALQARIDADFVLGRHSELVGELKTLTAANPLNERFRAQLMLALYRSGRQADALAAYQQARRTLAEEVGLAPGPDLQRLEKAIFAHDPALEFEQSVIRAPVTRRRRRLLLGSVALLAAAALATVAVLLTRDTGPVVLSAISPDAIGIVDPGANALVEEIPLQTRPAAIAFGAGSLWVGTYDRETLLRMDPRTRKVTQTIGLGAEPSAIAIADGYVWVLCSRGAKLLFQFDADSGVVIAKHTLIPQIPAGTVRRGLPFGRVGFELDEPLDIAAGAAAAWISYPYEVLRVDGKSGALEHIRAGAGGGIAFGKRAVWALGRLWNDTPPKFFRIDPEQRAVTDTIPVPEVFVPGSAGGGMAADANGVWSTVGAAVSKLVTEVGLVGTLTGLHHAPIDIAIGEGAVWTANDDGTVSRVDRRTGDLVDTIPLGTYPRVAYPVQLAAGGGAVWVAVH